MVRVEPLLYLLSPAEPSRAEPSHDTPDDETTNESAHSGPSWLISRFPGSEIGSLHGRAGGAQIVTAAEKVTRAGPGLQHQRPVEKNRPGDSIEKANALTTSSHFAMCCPFIGDV